jgi:hypothetical protein
MVAYTDLILIHRIDMNISSILGIIFSCFLLYFIHTKTSAEMKSYKRILIQGCVVDLCYAMVTLIATPVRKKENAMRSDDVTASLSHDIDPFPSILHPALTNGVHGSRSEMKRNTNYRLRISSCYASSLIPILSN